MYTRDGLAGEPQVGRSLTVNASRHAAVTGRGLLLWRNQTCTAGRDARKQKLMNDQSALCLFRSDVSMVTVLMD